MRNKIKQKLLESKEEQFQQFHKKLCPGTEKIIGVKIPKIKQYAKELLKTNSFEYLMKNIDNEYYEEKMLQAVLIGQAKEEFEVIINYVEEFIPKIDNWAVCDTFCAGLKITKKHKEEMWKIIKKHIKSDKEFEIRFAVVMILDFYIEEKYLSEIFEVLDNIKTKYYYARMAIAWAISICLIKYYEETVKYLSTCNLDKFTYNKAIQKGIESYRIKAENKQKLRKMKK